MTVIDYIVITGAIVAVLMTVAYCYMILTPRKPKEHSATGSLDKAEDLYTPEINSQDCDQPLAVEVPITHGTPGFTSRNFSRAIRLSKAKQYRSASLQVRRALRYAYVGQKLGKRDFRRLWIARINASAHMNGISYSRLMDGLKMSGITINRKALSDLSLTDPDGFANLVNMAKRELEKQV